MFKFLKSKRGFTLVELMIVVVIMAILVAVAVPIFSAVTANARKKTCAANRREIVSQLNNYAMSESKNLAGTFSITSANETGSIQNYNLTGGLDEASVSKLFQELPYCPADGTYTISCQGTGAGDQDGSITVTVNCDSGTDKENNAHV